MTVKNFQIDNGDSFDEFCCCIVIKMLLKSYAEWKHDIYLPSLIF